MKIKQKMKNWYLSYKDAKTTDVYRKEQSLITHSAERLKHVGNFDLTEEQELQQMVTVSQTATTAANADPL